MRESNYAFPAQNKACVCITSQLYDRRGEWPVWSDSTTTSNSAHCPFKQPSTPLHHFLFWTHCRISHILRTLLLVFARYSRVMAVLRGSCASFGISACVRLHLKIPLLCSAFHHRACLALLRLLLWIQKSLTARQHIDLVSPFSALSTSVSVVRSRFEPVWCRLEPWMWLDAFWKHGWQQKGSP